MTEKNYRWGTVHSVKGETFDAILLILKTKGIGCAYKTLLNKSIPISASEELRIAYVGMTRPSKVLVIAVPNEENKNAWENKLIGN
jgi:superfamily I DNA/RNA helicase